MAATTGTLTANGSTPARNGHGVNVQCLFKGDFGGGVIQLELSQDNGITYFPTGDRFSTPVGFAAFPFKAKYRFTLSGATSPSIDFVIGGE